MEEGAGWGEAFVEACLEACELIVVCVEIVAGAGRASVFVV